MLKGQGLKMLPPFVANEADPLFKFSDGAFHEECFRLDPLSSKVGRRLDEMSERSNPSSRRCLVCSKVINDPDDFFSLGHLTDDPEDPLRQFNFAQFHRSCLPIWSNLTVVRNFAEKQVESGAWKGSAIQKLVDILRNAKDK
jgi:hypothetical protein